MDVLIIFKNIFHSCSNVAPAELRLRQAARTFPAPGVEHEACSGLLATRPTIGGGLVGGVSEQVLHSARFLIGIWFATLSAFIFVFPGIPKCGEYPSSRKQNHGSFVGKKPKSDFCEKYFYKIFSKNVNFLQSAFETVNTMVSGRLFRPKRKSSLKLHFFALFHSKVTKSIWSDIYWCFWTTF